MCVQVAARVRTEDGEEQWILAEVVSYNSHNHRYVVDDIDEEGHNEKRLSIIYLLWRCLTLQCILIIQKQIVCTCIHVSNCRRYHVSKRRIIPLPRFKVDPKVHPQALFKPKQVLSQHAVDFTCICTDANAVLLYPQYEYMYYMGKDYSGPHWDSNSGPIIRHNYPMLLGL